MEEQQTRANCSTVSLLKCQKYFVKQNHYLYHTDFLHLLFLLSWSSSEVFTKTITYKEIKINGVVHKTEQHHSIRNLNFAELRVFTQLRFLAIYERLNLWRATEPAACRQKFPSILSKGVRQSGEIIITNPCNNLFFSNVLTISKFAFILHEELFTFQGRLGSGGEGSKCFSFPVFLFKSDFVLV